MKVGVGERSVELMKGMSGSRATRKKMNGMRARSVEAVIGGDNGVFGLWEFLGAERTRRREGSRRRGGREAENVG
jgi:hypothetical protein